MSYILVTGASGFVGSCLCERLLSLGYKVVGIGRKDAYNSTLKLKERGFLSQATLSHKNFKYERLELKNLNENSLKNYEFSLAFHLASMVEYASLEYLEYLEYTITPTLNLIDFALKRQIPKIIFSSTASVFAQPNATSFDTNHIYTLCESSPISPLSNYALAKYTCEKLLELATLRHQHFQAITLRFPAIFGLNHLGGIVYDLAINALKNNDIELFGRGRILRNILYIKDAIQALILSSKAQNLKPYELFVIGSKDSKTTHTIAQTLIQALHSQSKIILSDKLSPNPFNSALDCTKAQNLLSFSPPSIADGLKQYANELLSTQHTKGEHL